MRKSGTLQYKCHRCGRILEPVHVPDLATALIISCVDPLPRLKGYEGLCIKLMCDCGDGGVGIADLIGGKYDNDKKDGDNK